jgi:hypothetical protein
MKLTTTFLILGVIILVAVIANAMPVRINELFIREIPAPLMEYPIPNIPTPDWWPH